VALPDLDALAFTVDAGLLRVRVAETLCREVFVVVFSGLFFVVVAAEEHARVSAISAAKRTRFPAMDNCYFSKVPVLTWPR
jgi:hypothetical protein